MEEFLSALGGNGSEQRQQKIRIKQRQASVFYGFSTIPILLLIGGWAYATVCLLDHPDDKTSFDASTMIYLAIFLFAFLIMTIGYLFNIKLEVLFEDLAGT